MIYCFRCPDCKEDVEVQTREPDPHCTSPLVRDYNREFKSQSVAIPVHMQSRVNVSRNDVLPTAKDFEAPGDTDGSKGMANWEKTHAPVNRKAWV